MWSFISICNGCSRFTLSSVCDNFLWIFTQPLWIFCSYFLHLLNPDGVGVSGLRALLLTHWLTSQNPSLSWKSPEDFRLSPERGRSSPLPHTQSYLAVFGTMRNPRSERILRWVSDLSALSATISLVGKICNLSREGGNRRACLLLACPVTFQ